MEEYILILDNEYENVSDLEEIINKAISNINDGFYRELRLEEDSESSIEYLRELKSNGKKISAIIADEHLYREIDGSDFLRICRGHLNYLCTGEEKYSGLNWSRLDNFSLIEKIFKKRTSRFDNRPLAFVSEIFDTPKDYGEFIEYFLECDPLIVMLCGHPSGVDVFGIEDVPIIQKRNGCEYDVLGILESDELLLPERVEPVLSKHPRLANPADPKKLEYTPTSKRRRRIKKKYLK